MNIRNDRGIIKWLLIGLCAIFLIVALVLPLMYVIVTALRDGWNEYVTAISDTYAVKSILLTLKVVVITVVVNTIFGLYAAWLITKFTFRGKKIISTLIDLPLTISPIIAGLIFVLTFGRQSFLYPYLEKLGIQIFSQITLPHIRWALLYGIVLCSARAMGEFGAVSVLS